MRSFRKTVLVVLGLALVVGGYVLFAVFLPASWASRTVEVRVEQGESFPAVLRKLQDNNLIRNAKLFSIWARLTGSDRKIQWGVYRFDLPLSQTRLLRLMVEGRGVFHRVTVPEGLTLKETSELLASAGLVNAEKFLAEAKNPELLGQLGLKQHGVEGYLFPSTYNFVPDTTEGEIIAIMVQQFRKAAEPFIKQQEGSLGLSLHEIVTLASIIEKETGLDAERPIVSAVFHNRLRIKMPLQSDPTVIYGLEEFDGNLRRKHLRQASPYNTYVIGGLPPGPICNPGLASIKAALEPADVSFLYFVSKNDGSHAFSHTLEEHVRAVRLYQLARETAPVRIRNETPAQ